MTVISCLEGHAGHHAPGHPERPERLNAIRDALAADTVLSKIPQVSGPLATRRALERVHPAAYLDLLEAFCERGGGALDVDTYATAGSYHVARRACGDLLAITDAVLQGAYANGFALGRPPGHHARPMQAMGFCLLANVAVAVRHAQAAGVGRVLVLDMDVHHGNGTQEVFYDDPSVLFVSVHQADIYPGTGHLHETGADAGRGTTVNLPVPGGTGDELVRALPDVLRPLADRFRPEVVFVSAGFDGHRLDPLGGLNLSVRGLSDLIHLAHEVAVEHAQGRLVCSLEGGYHAEALAASVVASLHRMVDPSADVQDPFGPTTHPPVDLGPLLSEIGASHRLNG